MTNIIKSALIIGSLLAPAAAFAGDPPATTKPADKTTDKGAADKGATTDKPTTDKGAKDVKKDTKPPAKTPAKTPPAKDATPPATK